MPTRSGSSRLGGPAVPTGICNSLGSDWEEEEEEDEEEEDAEAEEEENSSDKI